MSQEYDGNADDGGDYVDIQVTTTVLTEDAAATRITHFFRRTASRNTVQARSDNIRQYLDAKQAAELEVRPVSGDADDEAGGRRVLGAPEIEEPEDDGDGGRLNNNNADDGEGGGGGEEEDEVPDDEAEVVQPRGGELTEDEAAAKIAKFMRRASSKNAVSSRSNSVKAYLDEKQRAELEAQQGEADEEAEQHEGNDDEDGADAAQPHRELTEDEAAAKITKFMRRASSKHAVDSRSSSVKAYLEEKQRAEKEAAQQAQDAEAEEEDYDARSRGGELTEDEAAAKIAKFMRRASSKHAVDSRSSSVKAYLDEKQRAEAEAAAAAADEQQRYPTEDDQGDYDVSPGDAVNGDEIQPRSGELTEDEAAAKIAKFMRRASSKHTVDSRSSSVKAYLDEKQRAEKEAREAEEEAEWQRQQQQGEEHDEQEEGEVQPRGGALTEDEAATKITKFMRRASSKHAVDSRSSSVKAYLDEKQRAEMEAAAEAEAQRQRDEEMNDNNDDDDGEQPHKELTEDEAAAKITKFMRRASSKHAVDSRSSSVKAYLEEKQRAELEAQQAEEEEEEGGAQPPFQDAADEGDYDVRPGDDDDDNGEDHPRGGALTEDEAAAKIAKFMRRASSKTAVESRSSSVKAYLDEKQRAEKEAREEAERQRQQQEEEEEQQEEQPHHHGLSEDEAATKITKFMRRASSKHAVDSRSSSVKAYLEEKQRAELEAAGQTPDEEDEAHAAGERRLSQQRHQDPNPTSVASAAQGEEQEEEEQELVRIAGERDADADAGDNVGTEVAAAPRRLSHDLDAQVAERDLPDNAGGESAAPRGDGPLEAVEEHGAGDRNDDDDRRRQQQEQEREGQRQAPQNPSQGSQAQRDADDGGADGGNGGGDGQDPNPPSPFARQGGGRAGEAAPPVDLAPEGTTRVTMTVNPMGFRCVETVAVRRRDAEGDAAASGWELSPKALFEGIASKLCVHPQSFQIFRHQQRLRFNAPAVLLEADRTAADPSTQAEPLWVTVVFPEPGTRDADTDGPLAAAIPEHLAQLEPEDVLQRCVKVRKTKPVIDPETLLFGRSQGLTFDEVVEEVNRQAVVNGDDANIALVAVVHDPRGVRNPFIGGFRAKHDHSQVFLHAATQLFQKDLDYSPFRGRAGHGGGGEGVSRQTQTLGTSRSTQTRREGCVQTPRLDLLTDATHHIKMIARTYFSAAELQQLRTAKAVTLQKMYRLWKARGIRRALEEEEADRQRRAEQRQLAEEGALFASQNRDKLRRAEPKTNKDFDRIKAEIVAWREGEAARVRADTSLTPAEQRAALVTLSKQELALIQDLEGRRRTALLAQKERNFDKTLEKMSAERAWGSVAVHTPETQRAGELRDLYRSLTDPQSQTTANARLDILLHVKWTVKEFAESSAGVRELCELIDREADLLDRGRRGASLTGLRARIAQLFKHFIEDPEYNPGMAEYTRTATGRAKARQLYGTQYTTTGAAVPASSFRDTAHPRMQGPKAGAAGPGASTAAPAAARATH